MVQPVALGTAGGDCTATGNRDIKPEGTGYFSSLTMGSASVIEATVTRSVGGVTADKVQLGSAVALLSVLKVYHGAGYVPTAGDIATVVAAKQSGTLDSALAPRSGRRMWSRPTPQQRLGSRLRRDGARFPHFGHCCTRRPIGTGELDRSGLRRVGRINGLHRNRQPRRGTSAASAEATDVTV